MRLASLTALVLAFPPALAAQDGSVLERVRAALELPVLTSEAREAGVSDERVSTTIWDIFRSGVPADDASRILGEEVRTVREGGAKDNFGAYVHSRVEAGLRGRELADAIHREHARRGMGKPAGAGKPARAGKPADTGKPDAAEGRRDARVPRTGKPEADRPAKAGRQGQGDSARPSRESTGAERGRRP